MEKHSPNEGGRIEAVGTDQEETYTTQRTLERWQGQLFFWACVVYTTFHLVVLNVIPMETWTFRIVHVAGGLAIGFAVVAAAQPRAATRRNLAVEGLPMLAGAVTAILPLVALGYAAVLRFGQDQMYPPPWVFEYFGPMVLAATAIGIVASWVFRSRPNSVAWYDWVLIASSVSVAGYLLFNLEALQFRAGVMPTPADFYTTLAGTVLILEVTRRLAGLALVVISAIFIFYSFFGPYLPGFLNHSGYAWDRFFTYVYTDNGILGPTTAVSSTYIVLFVAFAAFLQASKVGDYFVNFAFALAGRARGGPAKVAVFASALMGMINGTSAGNVVATGSLTIPLMKRVGYSGRSAGAIEAAASTGGQIMPPVMGAGAFIMAEVTGIPYTSLVVAAIIPSVLYFASVYFMVDFEARKVGMQGLPASELPILSKLLRQAYLFAPILILCVALFAGYSVIRAGTVALFSAIIVSWLTKHKMSLKSSIGALDSAARMSLQLIAVCACAGIIVGVIGLTGVGLRFSSVLLALAEQSQLLALFFAMCIAILLGMGMPTTAAYAVAASVVAPGLIQLGITPLIAHFFVFYYAVISSITPPVALAAYAGAAIAGADPMKTSVTAFKFGISAFIVPFMFFYSPALLMEAEWYVVLRSFLTASLGVYLLSGAAQGWFFGKLSLVLRPFLFVSAICMILSSVSTDLVGIGIAAVLFVWQRRQHPAKRDATPAESSAQQVSGG